MSNLSKKAEKNGKVLKVKATIYELGRVIKSATNGGIRKSQYNEIMNKLCDLSSDDIVCCNLKTLEELSPIVKNAVESCDGFPADFEVLCKTIDEKIDMYIDTRKKQSESGQKSGSKARDKANAIIDDTDDSIEVANRIIDEFDEFFGSSQGVNNLDIKTTKKLNRLSHKILGYTIKHIDKLT
jgi:hypothetical protein